MIVDYNTLVSAIKNYAQMDDPTDVDPAMSFIVQNAQQRLSRDFHPPGLMFKDPTLYSVNTSTGIVTISTSLLDARFRGFSAVYWTSTTSPDYQQPLFYRTPEFVFDYIDNDTRGTPKYYSKVANSIYVAPIPDSGSSVVFNIYVQPTVATSAHPTNYYIDRTPTLLFYAAMAEMSRFMKSPTAVTVWEQSYERELTKIVNEDRRERRDSQKAPGSPAGTNTLTGGP